MIEGFSWEAFAQLPVIGILRNFPAALVETLASRFQAAGLTTLEVTMNSHEASETISWLSKEYKGRLNVGAGTVCTMEDLDKALEAGASFIVTPVLDESIIKACTKNGVPVFPGAYTPTEIYKAWSFGASMVKVFPATRLGPEYIREVLAPLNQIKLIPTGGVTVDNFTEFLKAGAKGVGAGSSLFPQTLIQNGAWEEVSGLFSRYVEKFQAYNAAGQQ